MSVSYLRDQAKSLAKKMDLAHAPQSVILEACARLFPQATKRADLQDIKINTLFYLRWVDCGCPAFMLTEPLAISLSLSDIPNDPRLPLNTFVIGLPDNFPMKYKFAGMTDPAPVSLIKVIREENGGFRLACMPRAQPLEFSSTFKSVPSSEEEVEERQKRIKHVVYNAVSKEIDNSYLIPDEEKHLELNMLRIALNLASYIDGIEKDIIYMDVDHPLIKLGQVNRKKKNITVELGSEITIRPELRMAFARQGTSGWVVDKRFIVRGHWRHYADHDTWIRPYWKGPVTAQEVLERSYHVET